MTAEDYNEIADAMDLCTMVVRRGDVVIAVSFDAHQFASIMRSRAGGAISVPSLVVPDGAV